MRKFFAFMALAASLAVTPGAFAADQVVKAGNGDALAGLNGKFYWQLFALCETSLRAEALQHPAFAAPYTNIANSSNARALARLMADRGIVEADAQKLVASREKIERPVEGIATTCNQLIRKHDKELNYTPAKKSRKKRKHAT